MVKVANRLESINEYYFSQKLREIEEMNKTGDAVINLGIGSPDMAPHQDVIDTLNKETQQQNVHGYQGYKGVKILRDAIAGWYKNSYDVELNSDAEILPLLGSKEGIMHICMTYLNEGDEALIPNPGYPTYRSAVTLAGGVCRDYDLKEDNNWYPDFEALEREDLSKVKLMWVNYPHMPTGQVPSEKLFKEIVEFGKKHNILICHDNPYSFILNKNPISLLAFDERKEVVIELNSLSKSHNMAGWRMGMLCAAKERINDVLRFKSNMDSGMFLPVQLAAAKALSLGADWHKSLNEKYAERRAIVYELLDLLNCTYSKKQAGLFVWAKIPASYNDSYALSDEVLHKARVFITPGGIFGSNGEQFIRVSLCSTTEGIAEAINKVKAAI